MHPLEKRILVTEDLKPINSLSEYKSRGGLVGLEKARAMSSLDLIGVVKKSGLRGRGGAGFPMAIKWDTVFNAPDPKKYVVCNFAEGEPGTYKDRYFILKNPYVLFEGLLIAAHAIKATQAVIGTKEKFKRIVPRIQGALKEFEDAGIVPKDFIRIVLGPDEYLFGEEKALLEVIDGRTPMPRFFPPFLVGVNWSPTETNPTVVSNAESLSRLPSIIVNGPEWFRSVGTEDTPGTVIFSLSGDVKKPGMYEIPTGLTVRQLLYDVGGGPRNDKPFKAVFSGVANRVMTPDQFDLKIDFGTLRAAGIGLGSAGFMVYDESRCIVRITHMFSRFLAASSCGQCVPCNSGTRDITELLYKLEYSGTGTQEDIDAILDICGRCTSQTRCFLPTQESVLVGSCIKKFLKEFQTHIGQPCPFPPEEYILPKLEYFDDETGQFTCEQYPKEWKVELPYGIK